MDVDLWSLQNRRPKTQNTDLKTKTQEKLGVTPKNVDRKMKTTEEADPKRRPPYFFIVQLTLDNLNPII